MGYEHIQSISPPSEIKEYVEQTKILANRKVVPALETTKCRNSVKYKGRTNIPPHRNNKPPNHTHKVTFTDIVRSGKDKNKYHHFYKGMVCLNDLTIWSHSNCIIINIVTSSNILDYC